MGELIVVSLLIIVVCAFLLIARYRWLPDLNDITSYYTNSDAYDVLFFISKMIGANAIITNREELELAWTNFVLMHGYDTTIKVTLGNSSIYSFSSKLKLYRTEDIELREYIKELRSMRSFNVLKVNVELYDKLKDMVNCCVRIQDINNESNVPDELSVKRKFDVYNL